MNAFTKGPGLPWVLVGVLIVGGGLGMVLALDLRDDLEREREKTETLEGDIVVLRAERDELEEVSAGLEEEVDSLQEDNASLQAELAGTQQQALRDVRALVRGVHDCWDALDAATDAFNGLVRAYNAALFQNFVRVDIENALLDGQLIPAWNRAESNCFSLPNAPPPPPPFVPIEPF